MSSIVFVADAANYIHTSYLFYSYFFMNIGKSIKMCRTALDLSQEELAKKVDLSTSYVSLIEQSKRDPALSTVKKIADALEVPLSLLMFLAADREELRSVPKETQDVLAGVTLKLLNAKRRL